MTLIELLVVVGIIALLAAVALSQYAMYKQKAVDSKMQSTLHGARQAMEGYYASAQPPTYAGATETDLRDHGYRSAEGVTLAIVTQTQSAYTVRVCSIGGSTSAYQYDSTIGMMLPNNGTCP